MKRERIIKRGTCPQCGTIYYRREETEPSDDFVFVKCVCQKCDKEFQEIFKLTAQEWEE